ncbi:MAG: N-acetylglucosamine kinase, partial [Saprospiraceae bacterium]|nr:N-acetylglucosamine kinase [Saprospiraceae bacterium]
PGGIDEIKEKLYAHPDPNVFLANFVPYLTKFSSSTFVHSLVTKAFDEFVEKLISQYINPDGLAVHFVGSIAANFQNELRESLEKHSLILGNVVKQPADALAQYIMQTR